MTWADELAALMPPSANAAAFPVPPGDPGIVAGLQVPPSYREFCERWGNGGSFLDEIWFFRFGGANAIGTLLSQARHFEEDYGTLRAHWPDEYRMPALPADGGFLPFGIDGNGDWFGWRVADGGSPEWPVAILAHEDGMPEDTGLGFGPFMLAVARREFRSRVLHPGILLGPLLFEPKLPDGAEA